MKQLTAETCIATLLPRTLNLDPLPFTSTSIYSLKSAFLVSVNTLLWDAKTLMEVFLSSSAKTALTPTENPSEVQTHRREGSFTTLLGRHTQKHNFVFQVRRASAQRAVTCLALTATQVCRDGDKVVPWSRSHPLPLPPPSGSDRGIISVPAIPGWNSKTG